MAVTRQSLRNRSQAEQDFYSPMTGGTQIRYADAPTPRRDTYSSRVKDELGNIGTGTRTRAPIIEAIKVAVQKTDDPFTQIAEKKSYAPAEENDFLGDAAGAVEDAVDEGVSQVKKFAKSSNRRLSERRAERQLELKQARDERAALRGDMKKLFERDRRMYGNTVPKGSMGSGSKPGPAVDTNVARHSVGRAEDQPGAGVKKTAMGTTFTGIGTREFTKKFTQKPKTERQSVAKLPSNYKATEKAAFDKAKRYKAAAAIAKRNPNVSINKKTGKAEATNNSARARAQAAAVNRKMSGKSIGQTKAANRASMKAAAAARHASFKKAKAAGTHTRTAAGQRAAKRNAAKQRAKNAAKARNKAKKSKKGKKGGGGCPDPMMLILMANGSQKRAGDLMVGDLIKTNHEKDMKSGEYKVEYVNILNNREKAKFIFEESEIVCSLTHKFYVNNDWKEADDMIIGDEVSGQKLISIEDVEDGDVVHITVEDAHTYICQGLLSHNKRCDIKTKVDISDLTNMNLLRDDLADVAYFVKELKEIN